MEVQSLDATLANAAEGGVYTSIDDALRQATAVSAGAQDKFSPVQSALATGIGAVAGAGAGLTAGASAAVPLVKKAAASAKGFVRRLFGN